MSISFNDKLLYFLAAWADYNRCAFSFKLALSLPDDPRRYYHRDKILKCLKDKNKRQKIYGAIHSLKKHNFIKIINKNNTIGYVLTKKGELKLSRRQLTEKKHQLLPKGQYFMVFYDIPERQRVLRDIFRFYLQSLGFTKIQRSVWTSSYQIKKELQNIINEYQINQCVRILLVREELF